MGVGYEAKPCPLYPGKKTQHPSYRRLGEPQRQSGLVLKIWPPLGFDPQTVQFIVCCYTNNVISTLYILVKGEYPNMKQVKTLNMK
jgi:hypothetical protein